MDKNKSNQAPIEYVFQKIKNTFHKADDDELRKIESESIWDNIRAKNQEPSESPPEPPADRGPFESLSFLEWIKHPFSWMSSIIIVLLLIYIGTVRSPSTTSSTTYYSSSTYPDNYSLSTSSETVLPEIVKVSESDIVEVDYTYLVNNPDKYKDSDKYFRVAGKISNIYSSYFKIITLKTSDNKDLDVYMQSVCDVTMFEKDMFVTLVAKYKSDTSNSLSLRNGYVEETEKEAEQTNKRLTAVGDKLRAADKKAEEERVKAEKEKAKKAKKDYIDSCKTYKYKDIARNPDKYYGKRAKFKGEVVQVVEGYFDTTLRVDVTKDKYGIYTDTMYVVYTPESSTEDRILEDDIITIYGELAGIETYETIMGSKVSIPRIDAEYITINSK